MTAIVPKNFVYIDMGRQALPSVEYTRFFEEVARLANFAQPGISTTVTLAKLTGGGANGSLTFVNGILTAATAPT